MTNRLDLNDHFVTVTDGLDVAVGDAWVAARQDGPSIHDPDKRRLRS